MTTWGKGVRVRDRIRVIKKESERVREEVRDIVEERECISVRKREI